jgi:ATP-dependent RNA helicase DHX29
MKSLGAQSDGICEIMTRSSSGRHVREGNKHDGRKKAAKQSSSVHHEISKKLKTQLDDIKNDSQWQKMFAKRSTLPICALADELLNELRIHDAVVVCGETGCGKTTQVPQFLLDDAIERGEGGTCNIICTQPRRVAATSIAERVSAERCENNGVGGAGSLVGYHVRLDAKVTSATRLTFCTTGILLRRLQGDRMLSDVTHIVVDEVHERSLDGDFLLTLLRDLPTRRRQAGLPPVKLVLMSATLNASLFSGYLGARLSYLPLEDPSQLKPFISSTSTTCWITFSIPKIARVADRMARQRMP